MPSVIHNYESPNTWDDNVENSRRSDESYVSQSTAPTSLCDSPRPSLQHHRTDPRFKRIPYDGLFSPANDDPCRSSRETYDSTLMSTSDLYEEPEEYDHLDYTLPDYTLEADEVESRPSTSQDFSHFFPSQRRLCIRHDDTTIDGNMNLRVETELTEEQRKVRLQLFHLRIHDLKERRFSLRRYCRDSGREVCHSARRYTKPAAERPGIQRSMSNALATIRKPEMVRRNSGGSVTRGSPTRQDSGYGSTGEDDLDDVAAFMGSGKGNKTSSLPIPTNTTKLEFSNYAQVDVRRRGSKNNKRYEFEYWGSSYKWKRVVDKNSVEKTMSYHLVKENGGRSIAHIVPEFRSRSQKVAEEEAGGWVPPCTMWISDNTASSLLTDVADVIVATSLIALVDDCIKLHFHPKPKISRQFSVPLMPLNLEYVGPKAFVEHVFRRRNSADKEKDGWSPTHSPLRHIVD